MDFENKKILSLGLSAKMTSPHKGRGLLVEKITRNAYRSSLETDMKLREIQKDKDRELEQRHPLEEYSASSTYGSTRLDQRQALWNEEKGQFPGYPIGNQTGNKDLVVQKKERQLRYLHDLDSDIKVHAEVIQRQESPERRPVPRRPISPELTETFSIGSVSAMDSLIKKEKEKLFFELNQQDIERKRLQKSIKSNSLDIDGKFAIGVANERDENRKKDAQRKYLDALRNDIGNRDSSRQTNDDVYINHTGWSGLNVGEDESKTINQKKEKQETYRRMLDRQKDEAEKLRIKQEEDDKINLQDYTQLPYMEHRN